MTGRSIFGIASLIAAVTLLAKGVGFGRELVVAAFFGAGSAKDSYTIAYILPAFSLVMLGGLTGPFHTTTQKMIVNLKQQGHADAAIKNHVASLLLGVTLLLGLFTGLCFAVAPGLIALIAPDATPAVMDLAIAQLRWMSPLILLGGIIGILCGISNEQNDFMTPSLSPLVASVAVILVTLFLAPDPMALAWGTSLGALGQLAIQLPAARRFFSGTRPSITLWNQPVQQAWQLLGPAALGSTIGTLHVMVGTRFAASLNAGSISVFDYANKLIQLPLGILMTALLIPLFPKLAAAASAHDHADLSRWLQRGIETILVLTIPLVALFVAASPSIVHCIYERGAFDHTATEQTAWILTICACGIVPYALRDLLVRAFYALNDGSVPLWTSAASIPVAIGLMAVATPVWGLSGLAVATVSVTVLNALILAILLKQKIRGWTRKPILTTLLKTGTAGLVATVSAYGIQHQLPLADTFWKHLLQVGICGFAIATIYPGMLWVLKVSVTTNLVPPGRLKQFLKRSTRDQDVS